MHVDRGPMDPRDPATMSGLIRKRAVDQALSGFGELIRNIIYRLQYVDSNIVLELMRPRHQARSA